MPSLASLARLSLRAIPRGTVVRVLRGPARGARWVVGAGAHGNWIGTYERDTQQLIAAHIRPGCVFYDLGANVGLYTVLAARLGAIVHAFEPDAANRAALQRHITLNRLTTVTVHGVAVADRDGWANFTGNAATGHLADEGTPVRTVALDSLDVPPPDLMKIDVEGAELAVLNGARQILAAHRPVILWEPHGAVRNGTDVDRECLKLLHGLHYDCTRHPRGDYLCVPHAAVAP